MTTPQLWLVQYGETRLGDPPASYIVKNRRTGQRVVCKTQSDAIAESQRLNGWEPVDGSEVTYSSQVDASRREWPR